MANTNPPDKVDDREAPGDRHIDAPNANAYGQEIGDGKEQDHDQEKGQPKANPPAGWRTTAERDGADLIGDGGVRVPGLEDGSGRRLVLLMLDRWCGVVLTHEANLNQPCVVPSRNAGLGLRRCARYVVRGRVFNSANRS